ncbi:MAG TPA: T9SS type A sorting domain-containing protein [Bacteroidetes bacterium]|nr:BNR/Asp-box repeat protein [bacterium BMS3Bbin04]HDO65260.1 T9SS type A sorting domain-containing protein [Bacteroidota bacterium]HEX04385.1 T9SS type A sorting domain-containing protein [Bacteroidota bacterium]
MRDARGYWHLKALLLLLLLLVVTTQPVLADIPKVVQTDNTDLPILDERIWSISYWQMMAELGLVEVAPDVPFAPPSPSMSNELDEFVDGPDMLTSGNFATHQSENSIFIDPNDTDIILNSNNSSDWPLGQFYGASSLFSMDGGDTWGGQIDGWGGGDPAVVIDQDGIWYLGHIGSNQSGSANGITVSTNQGQSYTTYQAGASNGSFLDKNHLWIDNNVGSPFEGRLYAAWTDFYGANDGEVEAVWSDDNGQTWNNRQAVSDEVSPSSLNQGVNLDVGPNGEVYATWAVYNGPLTEIALGFAKSIDGGVSWLPATTAINNIHGIRSYGSMEQNHRKNSFPSMTVDISEGPNQGDIYIVWPNLGVPGVNSGPDVGIWMIKSTDGGQTWADPVRINTDDPADGNQHYFAWIHCDPVTGVLNAIWYDNRNSAYGAVEAWVGISYDGGATWENYRVSDVSFTPSPIPGFATGYFGDYLSIHSRNGIVVPCWTDNRNGVAMTYVSPYVTDGSGPPVTITLEPAITPPIYILPSGGNVTYDANVRYNAATPQHGQAWTQGRTPNGDLVTLDVYQIDFTPGMVINVTNQTVNVPGTVPAGTYQFVANVGFYPNFVADSDEFDIIKLGTEADGASDWSTSDWMDAELAAEGDKNLAASVNGFSIESATPNPFNPDTRISISIPDAGHLTVKVFNSLGQEVAVLYDNDMSVGSHNLTLSGSNLASGVYLVRAEIFGQTAVRRITLMK